MLAQDFLVVVLKIKRDFAFSNQHFGPLTDELMHQDMVS